MLSLRPSLSLPKQSWLQHKSTVLILMFGMAILSIQYGDGRFYDVPADPLEQQPLGAGKLDEAASKTRSQLQAVLDRMFRHN